MGVFFKHLDKATAKAAKNVGKKILNNPGRALELAANIGTAAASKNPKLIAASAPDFKKICTSREGSIFAENSLNTFNKCIQFIIGMTWKN